MEHSADERRVQAKTNASYQGDILVEGAHPQYHIHRYRLPIVPNQTILTITPVWINFHVLRAYMTLLPEDVSFADLMNLGLGNRLLPSLFHAKTFKPREVAVALWPA
jgi:hypothetical protein